jgi:hypothetical protein
MKELISIFSIEIVIVFFLLIIINVFNFIYTLVLFNKIKFKTKLFYPLDYIFFWKQIIQKVGDNKQAKKQLNLILYLTILFLGLFFYFIIKVKTGTFYINS